MLYRVDVSLKMLKGKGWLMVLHEPFLILLLLCLSFGINVVPSLLFSCSCVWLPRMENEKLNQDPREALKNRAVTINSFLHPSC